MFSATNSNPSKRNSTCRQAASLQKSWEGKWKKSSLLRAQRLIVRTRARVVSINVGTIPYWLLINGRSCYRDCAFWTFRSSRSWTKAERRCLQFERIYHIPIRDVSWHTRNESILGYKLLEDYVVEAWPSLMTLAKVILLLMIVLGRSVIGREWHVADLLSATWIQPVHRQWYLALGPQLTCAVSGNQIGQQKTWKCDMYAIFWSGLSSAANMMVCSADASPPRQVVVINASSM